MNTQNRNPKITDITLPSASQVETMLHKEIENLASQNKIWGTGEEPSTTQPTEQTTTSPMLLSIPPTHSYTPGKSTMATTTQRQSNTSRPSAISTVRQRVTDYLSTGGNLLYTLPQSNIVNWYFYAHALEMGQCPKSFHLWSCMSMLAALVQDKFYFPKLKGAPICPNLYVILVGPSGLGKDTAINAVLEYMEPYRDLVRSFAGRLTHASFTDFLCKGRTALPPNVRHTGMAGENPVDINFPHTDSAVAWVITPELAQSVSAGGKASELIKLMTSVYTATGRQFEEFTRQWGYHLATKPCVNWLAGTTQEWLIKSVGRADVKGGFASRVMWIIEDYRLDKLCGFPQYPGNFDEVKKYIEWRLYQLALDPGGEIKLSIEARFEIDTWYNEWKKMTNEEYKLGNKDYLPLYMRGHDLAIKLAMILRIGSMGEEIGYSINNPNRLVITQAEMFTAIRWVEQLLLVHYPKLIMATKELDSEAQVHQKVVDVIIKLTDDGNKPVTRKALLQELFRAGVSSRDLREVEGFLLQCGAVKYETALGDQYIYWTGVSKDWIGEEY